MLYADFNDIFISVCYSALFGIVMGILFVGLRVLIYTIDGFIRLPKIIYQTSDSYSKIKDTFANNRNFKYPKNKIKNFLFDFFYVVINGILFSLLLYVTADGVFRLYIFVIAFTLAHLFIKYLGNHTALVFEKAIMHIYSVIALFLSLLIFPLRKALRAISNYVIKILKNKKERKLCKITKKAKEKRIT